MARIKDYLYQDRNTLICKKSCSLTVPLESYSVGENMTIQNGEVWVSSLISTIDFDDIEFDIVLDYPIIIKADDMIKESTKIVFSFIANSVILESSMGGEISKEQIIYVKRLLSGKEIIRDPSHLLKKLYGVYGPVSSMDLVHLEVALCNLLRNSDDLSIPARLKQPYNAKLININSIPFVESFLSGIEFERITKAIETGLITDRPKDPSALEKILLGELV